MIRLSRQQYASIAVLTVLVGNIVTAQPIFAQEMPSWEQFQDMLGAQNIIPFYLPHEKLVPTCGVAPTNLGEATSSATAVSDGTAVAKDFSLGTDNNKRAVNLVRTLMADYSLTGAQASGIVGNFMWESGGAHLPPNINEGGKAGPPLFKGGYGWAQWTGARQKQFINFAIEKGYMTSASEHANDAANYAYLRYELAVSEKYTITAVAKTNTPEDAARAFEKQFERAGKPALEERFKAANRVFAALSTDGSLEGVTSSTTELDSSTEASCNLLAPGLSTSGVIFDSVVFPLRIASKQDVTNRTIFVNGTTNRAGHPYTAFDILAKSGTQVVAMTSGVVKRVVPEAGKALGGSVTVYDGTKNIHIFYTHMSPSVKQGDTIKQGDILGTLLSVKNYPSINADHLHIDAGPGESRGGCSRTNPGGAACKDRLDIGPDLFNAFQTIPEVSSTMKME